MFNKLLWLIIIMIVNSSKNEAYRINFIRNGPLIYGFDLNFTGVLIEDDGTIAPNDTYFFDWSDSVGNEVPQITSNTPYTNWSISYNKSYMTTYQIKLRASKLNFINFQYEIAKSSTQFKLSDALGGNLKVTQNNTERKTTYVSTLEQVNHVIELKKDDHEYITKKASYIRTYWFQNCTFMGQTNDLVFENFYGKENEEYHIEALLVASFEPLPEPTSSTTTTTTTSTTTTTTTTTPKPTTTTTTTTTTTPTTTTPTTTSTTAPTTSKTFSSTTTLKRSKSKRQAKNDTAFGNELVEIPLNNIETTTNTYYSTTTAAPNFNDQPFVCFNKSQVAPDPKKLYGYYSKRIIAKVPVNNVTVSGQNWLQPGEVLHLNVHCKGSNPIQYCIQNKIGLYNVTGNETCANWDIMNNNTVPFQHLFYDSMLHTVIFIIRNPVEQMISPVAVKFYEVKKQSQLSVIVVPVSASLIAVILVVFGVAYYIQNRERFSVEVADFNFGETQSIDMEYKTFQQRLFDSVRELIRRPQSRSDSDSNLDNGESNLQYGPMS